MAMTYKTITGQITLPGSDIGVRVRVFAVPLTTNQALVYEGDDRITVGPEIVETNGNGILPAFNIPTNVDVGELYWRFLAERLDSVPGAPRKWTVKNAVQITGTGTVLLKDLIEIDTIAVDAQILVNLSDLVQDAEDAAAQAEAAAAGFDIGTVTTGTAGSSAAATITGTAPDKKLNLTIPTGATGPAGPTGSAGPAGAVGATGPANSLSIGTVTTGVAGSSAGASVTGTAPSQTLSLTIPRGDKGDKGDKGDQGDVGPAGPSGSGSGDVVGPASSVDLRIAVFSGTTGKVLASSSNTVAGVLSRVNHTGTQSADTITDGTTNKAFLATERTKLTGIATGATANSADATLLARANHTGTQAASTITGLAAVATSGAYTDLSGKPTLGDAAAKNTGTTTGTLAAGDDSRLVNNAKSVQGGAEKVAALSATTGTATGDCSAASIFTVTPTGNITLAFSNVPATGTACTVTVIVSQGATVRTVTPPTGTKWMGAAAPTQVASKACAFTFLTVDGGTVWYASAAVEQ